MVRIKKSEEEISEYKKYSNYLLHKAKKIKAVDILGGKCSFCGENRLEVLEFHHVDKSLKEELITKLLDQRWSEVEMEIKKCICLCCNCHRELHANEEKSDIFSYRRRALNKELCLDYKNIHECQECGYNKNIQALDFHHLIPKTKLFTISHGTNKKRYEYVSDLEDYIKLELDKCVVFCANCHRLEHFNKEKYDKNFELIEQKSKNIKEVQPKLDREVVLKMYNSGLSQIEIARHFNASKGTICDILKDFGLTKNQSDITLDRNKVIELYKSGLNQVEVSQIMDCSKSAISNIPLHPTPEILGTCDSCGKSFNKHYVFPDGTKQYYPQRTRCFDCFPMHFRKKRK